MENEQPLTVGELIEQLQQYREDAPVFLSDQYDAHAAARSVRRSNPDECLSDKSGLPERYILIDIA
jgi:hypothetical protein